MFKYILASGSPRRIELLRNIISDFEVHPSRFNEEALKCKGLLPCILVQELSYEKAKDVFEQLSNKYNDLVVIGGDTIVCYQNHILGKPINEEDAFNMLKMLSGVKHSVLTGMSVIVNNGNIVTEKKTFSETFVYMKKISNNEIYEYISTKEPLDKAGAYAIQGVGKKYVEKYVGNFNTVVGLNTDELKKILKELQVL